MLPTSVRPMRNQRFRRDYVIVTVLVSCLVVLFVSISKMKSSPSPTESMPSKIKEAKTLKADISEESEGKVWNLEDTRFVRHSDQLNDEIGQFCEKMDRKLAICHISSMISPRLCSWMNGEINDDKVTTHPWTTHEPFSHGEKALDMIDSISYTLFDRFYNTIIPIIRERYDVQFGVLGINDASAVSGGTRLSPIPIEDHFHSAAFALILILETSHDNSPSLVTLDSQYLKSINHFTMSKNASTWVEHVHHEDEYAEIRVSPGDLIVIPGVYFLALKQYKSKIINCKSAILMEVGFNRYDSCRKYYFRDSIDSTENEDEGEESFAHHHVQHHQQHLHQPVGSAIDMGHLHNHEEVRRHLLETDVTSNGHGHSHGHGHVDSQVSHSDHSHSDHKDHSSYLHHDLHDHHDHTHDYHNHHDHDGQEVLSHHHDQRTTPAVQHQQYNHDHSQDGEFCSL